MCEPCLWGMPLVVCVCVCRLSFGFWFPFITLHVAPSQVMTNANVSTKEFFAKEIALTKTIIDACQAVFHDDKEKIVEFKKRFAEKQDVQSVASSGACGTIASLGRSPPTKSTQYLLSIQFIKSMSNTIYDRVHVKDDFKPLRNEVASALGPIKDLSAACRSRLSAVKSRKDAHVALKDQKFGQLGAPTAR